MAYAPLNQDVFNAAFGGAIAGMGASDRVPSNALSASYADLATVAGAFAQAFDTQWGAVAASSADLTSIAQLCEVAWQDRAPQNVSPLATPTNYTSLANALKAIVQAGQTYFTAQGIPLGTPISGTTSLIGRTTQAMGDANQTPTSAVLGGRIIRLTGLLTANRSLFIPVPTEAQAYEKIIENKCTGAFGVIVTLVGGVGTTATVLNGNQADVFATPDGVDFASTAAP